MSAEAAGTGALAALLATPALLEEPLRDLLALLLASVRLLVAMLFFPMVSGTAMAGLVRLCITLALACPLVPVVRNHWDMHTAPAVFLLILAKEAFLGLLLGFVAAAVFSAFNALGKILDQQMGSAQSAARDPTTSQPAGASSQFLVQLATTAVLVSGAFLILVGGLYESYGVWPLWSWWPQMGPGFASVLVAEFGRQTDLALQLALPFLALMLLVEVGSGLLARAVPGMECNALALSLKHFCVQWLLLILVTTLIAHGVALVASPALRSLYAVLGGKG